MSAIRTRVDYENTLQALGLCISARIPALIWGDPGQGKTAVIESVQDKGWHVETLIVSHYEPSDFAGLPLLDGPAVTLAPPAWAKRLAEHEGPSIAFFDEFSTASPALQAAALRPLTHYEVGALQLPDTVSMVAAANPADVAAAGWELAAPTASRFIHLQWGMPLEVFAESVVTGDWPELPVYSAPEDLHSHISMARSCMVGFLSARQSQLSAIPTSATDRGKAFPTPRMWEYAAILLGWAEAVGAPKTVQRLLVSGAVGEAVAHEFLAWIAAQELPNPEDVLEFADSFEFGGLRADRVYVVLQSVLAAVKTKPSADRWRAAVVACSRAADTVGVDPAVPVVRALMRPGMRPSDAQLPPEIKVFAGVLALSGLLKGA
ncbi:MAG: hypothetical protein V9G04_18365 [Nocardioides sp.]|jgi:hypothetical protein